MKMRINEIFKSKKYIFLFSVIVSAIEIVILNALDYPIPLEYTILPILGLFFGPYAVLGFTLTETAYDIIYFQAANIEIILFNAAITFIFGILPWKLWYSILNKNGNDVPNINRANNFIKLIIIMAITYLYSFGILYNELSINKDVEAVYFTIIITTLLMIFIMTVIYHADIPCYTPKKQIKRLMPDSLYLISLLISMITPVYFFIFNQPNDFFLLTLPNNLTLIAISVVFTVIFLFKPYKEDVFTIPPKEKPNTFYKICVSILVILLILSITLTTTLNHLYFIEYNLSFDPFVSYVYDFGEILFPFLIPMIIYIIFLERKVMNPLKKLSEYLSNDIEDYDDIELLKNNLNNITVNNEIKSLSDSLLDMGSDLVSYSDNLVKVTSEKEKYETELKLAREIQYSMIPTDFEKFYENKNIEIWGIMKAAREVGGDFYDYFQIDDENIGFVIGDVSGKGITAALIMVKAMTLIHDYIKHYSDLSKAVYEVNNQLCKGNAESLFVTSWIGKLNTKTGELTFVNAGHNPPLIKRNNGDFEYIKTNAELFLACMEDIPYKTETIKMNPGDALFLYTDGVTEANDDYNGFYGDLRLKDILNKHKNDDLEKIITSVENDIDEFCNHNDPFDDTTMFIIKRN